MKMFRTVGVAALALVIGCGMAAAQSSFTPGQWTRVNTPPQAAFGHALLLTDGSVLAITGNYRAPTGRWFRLIPDSTGSYLNGTWVGAGILPTG